MELKWSATPLRLGAVAGAVLLATVAAASTMGALGVSIVLLPCLLTAYSAAAATAATAEDRRQTVRLDRETSRLRRGILRDVGELVGAAQTRQAAETIGLAAAVRVGLEIALLDGQHVGDDAPRSVFSGGL